MLGSMATVPLPAEIQRVPGGGRIDAGQLRLYDQFGIEVPFSRIGPSGLRCLRISAQVYNSIGDYVYLGGALQALRGG
jgi:hypothetical protein